MMNTRRKFLVQSGIVTTALITAKPFNAIAGLTKGTSTQQLTFLHTPLPAADISGAINKISRKHINAVLLHTSKNDSTATGQTFDAVAGTLPDHFSGTYQLIRKGQYRVGVIETTPADWNAAEKADALAAYLKKEEGCHFVICISELGFRNRTSIDDVRLAERTASIDCIVGCKSPASPKLPYTAINKNRAEVILHYSGDKEASIGNMQISFDAAGVKNNIAFDHRFYPAGTKA